MHDALFALDVIEHLDDDRGAVAQMAQLLKPGGVAVISVPALPELFSEFDRIQGHRRRYVPDTLRAAFQNTGFGNPQIFWWGAWMVGVLRRMRSKEQSSGNSHTKTYSDYLRVPTWPIPLFMNMAYAWEKNRALNGRLSTGTSLFAVAVKQ
jgi:SAM-dependent methyltransferase